jgi:hypothetical protein
MTVPKVELINSHIVFSFSEEFTFSLLSIEIIETSSNLDVLENTYLGQNFQIAFLSPFSTI